MPLLCLSLLSGWSNCYVWKCIQSVINSFVFWSGGSALYLKSVMFINIRDGLESVRQRHTWLSGPCGITHFPFDTIVLHTSIWPRNVLIGCLCATTPSIDNITFLPSIWGSVLPWRYVSKEQNTYSLTTLWRDTWILSFSTPKCKPHACQCRKTTILT